MRLLGYQRPASPCSNHRIVYAETMHLQFEMLLKGGADAFQRELQWQQSTF